MSAPNAAPMDNFDYTMIGVVVVLFALVYYLHGMA